MRGVNKVILIGNLGHDPEIRYTTNGQVVAHFTLATTEVRTNKDSQKQEFTEWHRVVAWRRLAEICGEYLSKGRTVYIEGTLRTRSWEDKDGTKRQTTEVIAQSMQMLGGSSGAKAESAPQLEKVKTEPISETDDNFPENLDVNGAPFDNDIPF